MNILNMRHDGRSVEAICQPGRVGELFLLFYLAYRREIHSTSSRIRKIVHPISIERPEVGGAPEGDEKNTIKRIMDDELPFSFS